MILQKVWFQAIANLRIFFGTKRRHHLVPIRFSKCFNNFYRFKGSTSSISVKFIFSRPHHGVCSLVCLNVSPSSSAVQSSSSCKLTSASVRFTLTVYAPLDFAQIRNHPHDLPIGEYRKRLSKFIGINAVS